LHHEVPGINIPEAVRKKLAGLSPGDAPKYGVEVARNLLVKAKPLVNGAYLMPPASMPHLAGDVIEGVGQFADTSDGRPDTGGTARMTE
jgi:homocysteine S-methyltransferase